MHDYSVSDNSKSENLILKKMFKGPQLKKNISIKNLLGLNDIYKHFFYTLEIIYIFRELSKTSFNNSNFESSQFFLIVFTIIILLIRSKNAFLYF